MGQIVHPGQQFVAKVHYSPVTYQRILDCFTSHNPWFETAVLVDIASCEGVPRNERTLVFEYVDATHSFRGSSMCACDAVDMVMPRLGLRPALLEEAFSFMKAFPEEVDGPGIGVLGTLAVSERDKSGICIFGLHIGMASQDMTIGYLGKGGRFLAVRESLCRV